ncbi:MAG: M20/M25/M40 family metallo-hydrolase [Phycisphaerales bacterium]|nr:M20/M25/M40 family metallo-hydrolase [Phycisphaerales bacterium]
MSITAIDVRSVVDTDSAEDHLIRFLSIDGVSGQEAAIAAAITDELKKVGVPASAFRFDTANKRIPMPTQTGNLFVDLPGTRPGGPRLVFSTHMDTVPLCAGAKPKRENGRIVNANPSSALGGDNRTGCAALVALAETLIKHNLPHPPITLLFTVREESRLMGARNMDPKDLSGATMGFNVDSKLAAELVTGAVGGETWEADIKGKASHAGVAPEKGISATLAAAIAITEAYRGGWFGKVVKPNGRGTSNVGVFGGKDNRSAGDATNVVTDYVRINGESRSDNEKFTSAITAAFKDAFTKAAGQVKDDKGEAAQAKFDSRADYYPFRLPDDAPAVVHAKHAAESIGLKPTTQFSHGGLDSNWLARHGLPSVTFGAGQHEIHTVKEYVDLPEFADGCRMAVALATIDD